jgi:hypothetical protein
MIRDKVKICGTWFEVLRERMEDDKLAGESNVVDRLISVDTRQSDCAQIETFYHEVVHMMLGLGGYTELLDEKMEEALAQYLGHALHHFLADNPGLPVLAKEGSEND